MNLRALTLNQSMDHDSADNSKNSDSSDKSENSDSSDKSENPILQINLKIQILLRKESFLMIILTRSLVSIILLKKEELMKLIEEIMINLSYIKYFYCSIYFTFI